MKKIILGIFLLTLTLALNGCASNTSGEDINLNKNNKQVDKIKQQIDNMTLDEKIGQLITVGIDGYNLDDNAKDLIESKKVGGIILFKNNVNDSNQ